LIDLFILYKQISKLLFDCEIKSKKKKKKKKKKGKKEKEEKE